MKCLLDISIFEDHVVGDVCLMTYSYKTYYLHQHSNVPKSKPNIALKMTLKQWKYLPPIILMNAGSKLQL